MKTDRPPYVLGAVLAALFVVLWCWQSPGDRARLTPADVDSYIRRIQGKLPASPAEEAAFLGRLRAWGEADDGKPALMLNVMSYYDQIRRVPGAESITVTPVESNRIYESHATRLLLQLGAYPLVAGEVAAMRTPNARHSDLSPADASMDGVDRVLVVRYPSRRAFFELLSNPRYLPWAPYKFAALKLALLPLEPQAVIPDVRWIAGGLFAIVFLAVGWLRAARWARRA